MLFRSLQIAELKEKTERSITLDITTDDNPDEIVPLINEAKASCIAKAAEALASANAAETSKQGAEALKQDCTNIKSEFETLASTKTADFNNNAATKLQLCTNEANRAKGYADSIVPENFANNNLTNASKNSGLRRLVDSWNDGGSAWYKIFEEVDKISGKCRSQIQSKI